MSTPTKFSLNLALLLDNASKNIPPELKRVKIQKVLMTPALALTLLDKHNSGNRYKNVRFISVWAKLILANEWKINGDTLSIDWNQNIIDGQHRLDAVVQSGQSIPMIVVSGLDPAVYCTKDCGKPRTTKDTFERDGEKYSAKRSAATSVLEALIEKDLKGIHRNPAWGAKYMYALYTSNKTAFDSMDFKRKYEANDRLVNGVYAYFLIYKPTHTDKIHEYFTTFLSGQIINNKQPVLMREWLIKNKHVNNDHTVHKTIVCLLVKSINKFLTDSKDKSLINNKSLACQYIH